MKKRLLSPYLYILPALLLAAVFSYYPFINSVILSFSKVSGSGNILGFNGLSNYEKLFNNQAFFESIKNTLIFTIIFIPINIVLVVSAAILTERESKINKAAQTMFFLPMALSMSSAALLFKFMLNSNTGIINSILHTNIPWLTDPLWAKFSLVILSLFLDFGLNYILILSALKNLDQSIQEAASLDGANSIRMFFRIKLPLIMPTLSFVFIIALKNALLICAPILVLTEGGPFGATQTLVYYYYLEAFKNFNYASASTISVIIFLAAALLVTLYSGFEKKRERA